MKQPLITFLESEFGRLRARNPSYSLRAFAKRLKVNPSALSEVMNGKRMPTSRFGRQISDALNLGESEFQKLISNLPKKNTTAVRGRLATDAGYIQLEQDQYQVIEHWHYFAILSLTEVRGFKSTPEWIGKRLGISTNQAEEALVRMLRLNLLRKKNGRYVTSGQALATTSGIANPTIRRAHLRNLGLIEKSLENTALEDQDFSMVTVATSKAKLEEAKARLKTFRRELAAFLESGSKDEVYKLSMYLFPLTQNEKGDSQ